MSYTTNGPLLATFIERRTPKSPFLEDLEARQKDERERREAELIRRAIADRKGSVLQFGKAAGGAR